MFIAIEGIDGSGKSTLASSIEKFLSSYDYRVYRTYEPTDKFTVNKEILDRAGRDEPLLLLSLFLKDRIEHSNEIRRQLDMGNIVILYIIYILLRKSISIDWNFIVDGDINGK